MSNTDKPENNNYFIGKKFDSDPIEDFIYAILNYKGGKISSARIEREIDKLKKAYGENDYLEESLYQVLRDQGGNKVDIIAQVEKLKEVNDRELVQAKDVTLDAFKALDASFYNGLENKIIAGDKANNRKIKKYIGSLEEDENGNLNLFGNDKYAQYIEERLKKHSSQEEIDRLKEWLNNNNYNLSLPFSSIAKNGVKADADIEALSPLFREMEEKGFHKDLNIGKQELKDTLKVGLKVAGWGLALANFPTGLIVKGAMAGLNRSGLMDKFKQKVLSTFKAGMESKNPLMKKIAKGSLYTMVGVLAVGGLAAGSDIVLDTDWINNPSETFDSVSNSLLSASAEDLPEGNVNTVDFENEEEPYIVGTNLESKEYFEKIAAEESAQNNNIGAAEGRKVGAADLEQEELNTTPKEEVSEKNNTGNSAGDNSEGEEHSDKVENEESAQNNNIGAVEGGKAGAVDLEQEELSTAPDKEISEKESTLENADSEIKSPDDFVGQSVPQNNYYGDGGSMSIISDINGGKDLNNVKVGEIIRFPTQDESGLITGYKEVEIQSGDTVSELYQDHRMEERGLVSECNKNICNSFTIPESDIDLTDSRKIEQAEILDRIPAIDRDNFGLYVDSLDYKGDFNSGIAEDNLFNNYLTAEERVAYINEMTTGIVESDQGMSEQEARRIVEEHLNGSPRPEPGAERGVHDYLTRNLNESLEPVKVTGESYAPDVAKYVDTNKFSLENGKLDISNYMDGGELTSAEKDRLMVDLRNNEDIQKVFDIRREELSTQGLDDREIERKVNRELSNIASQAAANGGDIGIVELEKKAGINREEVNKSSPRRVKNLGL